MAILRSLFTLAALTFGLAACTTVDLDTRSMQPLPAKLVSRMSEKGMRPSDPIMIRIYKQESELEVWKRDRRGRYALLKTYPICRWSGKLGPKKREGDRQAPEGFYSVTPALMNPQSQYYLAFNLGFPNRLEQALGYEGTALMVHGVCSSSGCYALTNDGVAEIYAMAREAFVGGQAEFQVQSLPFRMTPQNLAHHKNDLNMAFWLDLKQGTDQFDVTRQPPRVAACGRRYVFGATATDPDAVFDPLAPCPDYKLDPSFASMVAAKQARDQARLADISASEVDEPLAYADGGMNRAFRAILESAGSKKLAKLTSDGFPVSSPRAALEDPYQAGLVDHLEARGRVAVPQ
ncbi:MAG: murein L,D-transpeptidase [Bosea sp.]|nr:murein L,D-transpeptidase [Bosea sp. (in: a-proteobacteria)]